VVEAGNRVADEEGEGLAGGGGPASVIATTRSATSAAGCALETDDQQMIYMHWKGLRHGPKYAIDRVSRGEAVDPSAKLIRLAPGRCENVAGR
jgi:hypothetical protein